MSLPRYAKYKESGLSWLRQIPEHWTLTPLKYIATLKSGGTPSKENTEYWDGDVPWASSKDLKSEWLSDTQDHITQKAIKDGAATLVPSNSILIVVRGMILLHTFPVTRLQRPTTINQDLKALIPNNNITSNYLAWLLRGSTEETFARIEEAAHGTKVLRMDLWASMLLPIPPLIEQSAITAFLDRETAIVDRLVVEQQRLIELLKEKLQTITSHAVIKGLNPESTMQPTSIDWLGDTPNHWSLKSLKHIVAESMSGPYGTSLTKSMYSSSGYRVYGQQQVISNDFGSGDYYIDSQKFDEMSRYAVSPDDILVSVIGTIGKVAVVPVDVEPGIINPRLVKYRCKPEVRPHYLRLLLTSKPYQNLLLLESKGTTMDILNMKIISQIPITIPPILEQQDIINYISNITLQFNALIVEAERAIDLLQERRMALISAAVTGKIDVRGLVNDEEEAA